MKPAILIPIIQATAFIAGGLLVIFTTGAPATVGWVLCSIVFLTWLIFSQSVIAAALREPITWIALAPLALLPFS